MDDEKFVRFWENAQTGVFPMFKGIDLKNYKSLEVSLFESFGGRIPVMHMKDRAEFEDLICKIFYDGKPHEIPKSMGAMAIKGWKDIFGMSHRAILLSDGYYSAVLPEEVGLSDEEWKKKSLIIRKAHECTHYYTLRAYGFMNNSLKDELIADAMGIIEAFGKYDADLFLRFLGLENYPTYRKGGRLENYLEKGLDTESNEFKIMQKKAYKASKDLESYLIKNRTILDNEENKLELINKLAEIEDLDNAFFSS